MIGQAIRARRFEARDGAEVLLEFSDPAGAVQVYSVVNASLGGLLAAVELTVGEESSPPEAGVILPEAKLSYAGVAHPLGRLAVRRHEEHDGWLFVAFSCVDDRVPLYGDLAKHFAVDTGHEDPFAMELGVQRFNLANFSQAEYDSPDLFQKCRDFELLREDMERSDRLPYYGVRHQVDGSRWRLSLPTSKIPTNYVNFASYDYLGLSADPEVQDAMKQAIDRFGISATAAPANSGQSRYHEELEHTLARMLRKEDCFLFSSGYNANLGALTSLLAGNDLAVADFQAHASIQDALGAIKGKVRHFRHNDNAHMGRILEESRAQHAGVLAITEGLFSMDGDVPDLKEFIRLARQHGARTFIDEVHSFGIIGPEGRGAAEQQSVLDDFDLYTGSFSKVPGTGGGFAAGSKAAIGWLRFFARCGLFSTALSPCYAAATLKSIEIIRRDNSRRKKLRENIRHFREGLEALGVPLLSAPESPIVPVVMKNASQLMRAHQKLLEQKVFVNVMVYPAVAVDQSRFRFTITANHSFSDIELALAALRAAIVSFE